MCVELDDQNDRSYSWPFSIVIFNTETKFQATYHDVDDETIRSFCAEFDLSFEKMIQLFGTLNPGTHTVLIELPKYRDSGGGI